VKLFEPIFRALEAAEVRYMAVGGLATVLHGFTRLTVDLDLVVDLAPEEAAKAIEALVGLGFVPRVPVPAAQFADPARRNVWILEKNMRVFTMIDPANPLRQVDLFVEPPLPFEAMWNRSELLDLGGYRVRVAAIEDLIAMKRSAGRPQDLIDIEALERIAEERRR
jgi:hypothetical protein